MTAKQQRKHNSASERNQLVPTGCTFLTMLMRVDMPLFSDTAQAACTTTVVQKQSLLSSFLDSPLSWLRYSSQSDLNPAFKQEVLSLSFFLQGTIINYFQLDKRVHLKMLWDHNLNSHILAAKPLRLKSRLCPKDLHVYNLYFMHVRLPATGER